MILSSGRPQSADLRNGLSTLKIRVKWRLSICCASSDREFLDVGPPLIASPAKRTKPMRSVKSLVAAGAASLLSSTAFAADMAIAPPPMYAPPPVAGFRRLVSARRYRHDQSEHAESLNNAHDPNAALFSQIGMGFDSATAFRSRCRISVQQLVACRRDRRIARQVELSRLAIRSASVRGLGAGSTTIPAPSPSAVFLANAYVDLGTWWCVTPFIGAGVGTSYNQDFGFQR